MKAFPHRTSLLSRTGVKSTKNLRRRMSVKGAIKKTRSIAVERESRITKVKNLHKQIFYNTILRLYIFNCFLTLNQISFACRSIVEKLTPFFAFFILISI